VPRLRQKMNMVFQSFNLFAHLSVLDKPDPRGGQAARHGPPGGRGEVPGPGSGWSVWPRRPPASRTSFRAARSSAWPSRAAWPWIPRSSCSTSRLRHSTRPPSARSWPSSARLARDGHDDGRFVTHEMDFRPRRLEPRPDMDEGVIYEEGTPQEIFDDPKAREDPGLPSTGSAASPAASPRPITTCTR